jgi:hypothetical protein
MKEVKKLHTILKCQQEEKNWTLGWRKRIPSSAVTCKNVIQKPDLFTVERSFEKAFGEGVNSSLRSVSGGRYGVQLRLLLISINYVTLLIQEFFKLKFVVRTGILSRNLWPQKHWDISFRLLKF